MLGNYRRWIVGSHAIELFCELPSREEKPNDRDTTSPGRRARRFILEMPRVCDRMFVTYLRSGSKKQKVLSRPRCIAPPAGYMYSGQWPERIAAGGSGALARVVPQPHRNRSSVGNCHKGAWEHAFRRGPIDSTLGARKQRGPLGEEILSHRTGMLPRSNCRSCNSSPNLRFVPIAVGTSQLDALAPLGNAIVRSSGADSKNYDRCLPAT